MISNNDFRKILYDRSFNLSEAELEQIINEELEKPEDTMDADLIEYCLDALNELNQDEASGAEKRKAGDTNDKRIKRSFKRAAVIAAAAVFLLAGTASVSALVYDVNLFDGLVELYEDQIRIRFDNSSDKADGYKLLGSELAKELADNGITPVLLPEALLTEEYEIIHIKYQHHDVMSSANITFRHNRTIGHLIIDKYSIEDLIPYSDIPDATFSEMITDVSGVTVFVFEQNRCGTIVYQDGLSLYFITTGQKVEKAIELVKTIK